MSGPLPSTALSRLCAATHSEDEDLRVLGYPTVTASPSGNSNLLITIAALVVMIAICAAVDLIRNRFRAWLKKIFTSRLTPVLGISLWTVACLGLLGVNQWMLFYLQQTMSNAKVAQVQWDFGQVAAVGLWVPVFYKLLLAVLVSLKPKSRTLNDGISFSDAPQMLRNLLSNSIEDLYESNTGRAPLISQDTESEDKESEKALPENGKPRMPESEKSTLASLEETEAALGRVKSILTSETHKEASQEYNDLVAVNANLAKTIDKNYEQVERDEEDEKAALMQDYKT